MYSTYKGGAFGPGFGLRDDQPSNRSRSNRRPGWVSTKSSPSHSQRNQQPQGASRPVSSGSRTPGKKLGKLTDGRFENISTNNTQRQQPNGRQQQQQAYAPAPGPRATAAAGVNGGQRESTASSYHTPSRTAQRELGGGGGGGSGVTAPTGAYTPGGSKTHLFNQLQSCVLQLSQQTLAEGKTMNELEGKLKQYAQLTQEQDQMIEMLKMRLDKTSSDLERKQRELERTTRERDDLLQLQGAITNNGSFGGGNGSNAGGGGENHPPLTPNSQAQRWESTVQQLLEELKKEKRQRIEVEEQGNSMAEAQQRTIDRLEERVNSLNSQIERGGPPRTPGRPSTPGGRPSAAAVPTTAVTEPTPSNTAPASILPKNLQLDLSAAAAAAAANANRMPGAFSPEQSKINTAASTTMTKRGTTVPLTRSPPRSSSEGPYGGVGTASNASFTSLGSVATSNNTATATTTTATNGSGMGGRYTQQHDANQIKRHSQLVRDALVSVYGPGASSTKHLSEAASRSTSASVTED